MDKVKQWALVTLIVCTLGVGVITNLKAIHSIQNQRSASILSDCRENNYKHRVVDRYLGRFPETKPQTLVLVGLMFPYHSDCTAVVAAKVHATP